MQKTVPIDIVVKNLYLSNKRVSGTCKRMTVTAFNVIKVENILTPFKHLIVDADLLIQQHLPAC